MLGGKNHPLDHPIVPQSNHEVSLQSSNSPFVRQPSIQDEPQILPEDPETRILYLRHWNTIRTEEATGNRVQHAFPSIKISTTNGTGDRVVVGFLVAFSVVCTLKLFSADVAGIGL
jgi:hypothetical protein